MFFYLSKILWFFIHPLNIFFIGLFFGTVLSWIKWRRSALWCLTLTTVYAVFLTTIPLGKFLIMKLENRFPMQNLDFKKVEGIVVLGGIVDQHLSKDRGITAINGAVERLIAFAELSKKYPSARLVFSGGSGVISAQELKEAHFVEPLFKKLGIMVDRISYEYQSRNTWENAVLTKKLINTTDEERWIVITSAFHMPRAVGCFRRVGWDITPYPVDYRTSTNIRVIGGLSVGSSIKRLTHAAHEWVGLVAYYIMGRTNAFLPLPRA